MGVACLATATVDVCFLGYICIRKCTMITYMYPGCLLPKSNHVLFFFTKFWGLTLSCGQILHVCLWGLCGAPDWNFHLNRKRYMNAKKPCDLFGQEVVPMVKILGLKHQSLFWRGLWGEWSCPVWRTQFQVQCPEQMWQNWLYVHFF